MSDLVGGEMGERITDTDRLNYLFDFLRRNGWGPGSNDPYLYNRSGLDAAIRAERKTRKGKRL